MADKPLKIREIALKGKLITSLDPAVIGENFQILQNLRYTPTNLKSITGMTKINSTAISTYLKTRSAIHFVKEEPAESHLLIQGWNTGETASQILQNTTAIPSTGDFSGTALHTDATNSSVGIFSEAPGGTVVYCNGVETLIWGGDEYRVGGFINIDQAANTFEYDFTEQVSNSTTGVLTSAKLKNDTTGTADGWILVGAVRPLKGIKIYIQLANTTTGTLGVDYWDGTAWTAVSTLVDGTSSGGISFAQTGFITFDDTEGSAKVSYKNNRILYWYRLKVGNMDDNIRVSYCTVDTAIQPVKDIWDGTFSPLLSAAKWDNSSGKYNDFTVDFADIDGVDGSINQTNVDILYLGFSQRMSGLNVSIGDTSLATNITLVLKYWDGDSWANVDNLDDGTFENSGSLNKSGVISWTPARSDGEFQTAVGETPAEDTGELLYFYRLTWSGSFGAIVKIDAIEGIRAPLDMKNYKFPLFAHNRLWLCSETDGKKNKAIVSNLSSSDVFNGDDSIEFEFGDDRELTAGAELYSQFGSNLYNVTVITKTNETWLVIGNSPEDWVQYPASKTIGCPAPATMVTAHITPETPLQTQSSQVVIWQGSNGIYIFDGRNFRPIHLDIDNYFDQNNSGSINSDEITNSVAFFDEFNQEYHWLFASGTSTDLDTELVYSMRFQKWYEIDRGTGKELQYGIPVRDTIGNAYNYGFIDTGYMERLENGTDFDGSDIVSEFRLGDIALDGGSIFTKTDLRKIKLAMVAKTTTTNNVTVTYYGSTKTTGTDVTMPPTNTGFRVASVVRGASSKPRVFHSVKFSMITDDETVGFEPLFVGLAYKVISIDK